MKTHPKTLTVAVAALLIGALTFQSHSASHSDAPLIKQDPQANITDVYAFVGTKYDDPSIDVLNVIVSTRPFSDPGDGLIYDRFADDVLYSIHIAEPDSGETVVRYDFTFSDVNPINSPGLKNPNTVLSYGLGAAVGPIQSIGDATQNYTQTYRVTKNGSSIGSDVPSGIPNVGNRTTPLYNDTNGRAVSGAAEFDELDAYTQQAITELSSGETVFAGPREDGFYADTPAIFDLLDSRILDNDGDFEDGLGQDGGGVDGFKGFNVLTYAIQIPVSKLENNSSFPKIDETTGDVLVGVWASTSRNRITLRRPNGDVVNTGPFVQVNRMGNPLFNEVFVPLADKDNYNRSNPTSDKRMFEDYALNPEVATLINTVFGTSLGDSGRVDLAGIFIPDVLRVATTPPPALPGQAGFSRLSFVDGDFAVDGIPGGWPNGRRPGDDVVDIALSALTFDPAGSGTPFLIGDNVPANDQLYHQVFPYLGTPHAGPSVTQRAP